MNREPTFMGPSLFRTLILVLITAVSFASIDGVLAKTERRETGLEAARLYGDGERLMQQRNYAGAIESFRSAIANARDNRDYPLALGQSLLDAGRLDEAEEVLTALLRTNSMAGPANLALARVFARESRFEEAAFYYHRAIYGQWRNDAAGNQLRARFELADFLASRKSKAGLLAELLPLQDEAPGDESTQKKLAGLYMAAGSPVRAAGILHDLARADPKDPDIQQVLGDAEFAQGDYPAAQAGFIAALRLRPDSQPARNALELTDQVLNLDPGRKGLSTEERYQRSTRVLQLVADKIARCPAPPQANASPDLVDAAHAALIRKVPSAGQSDAIDVNLALAGKLWRFETANCSLAISFADQPLQLILTKQTQ